MRGRTLTTFLVLETKRISTPAWIGFLCVDAYLHAKQALLADIVASRGKDDAS